MSTEIFEKVQKSLATIEEQNATLIKNYDQLDKDTKKTMEDLTMLKNSGADYAAQLRTMQKLGLDMKNERRMAYGDPIHSIARDHDKAAIVMAGLAKKLDILGHCNKHVQGVAKDLDGANTPGSTYLANAEIDREIYDLLMMHGAFRGLDVRTVGTRSVDIRIKTARAAMKFVDEVAAIGADAAKAGAKTNLILKKIAGLISVSNELAEDDITGVVEDILRDFVEMFQEKMDWIAFSADGTADDLDGGYTGLFYGGTARVAVAGNVSVETLDFEDWLACLINAPAAVLERPSKWWIHPTMLARSMTLKDTTGRPMFQTALEAPSLGAIGTILGYPVVPVGNAPSLNGVSKKIAAFGDPRGQAIRIRRELVIDRSKEWAFDSDEMTFRGTARAGSITRAATAFQVLTTAAA